MIIDYDNDAHNGGIQGPGGHEVAGREHREHGARLPGLLRQRRNHGLGVQAGA